MNKQGKIALGVLVGSSSIAIPATAIWISYEIKNPERVLHDSKNNIIPVHSMYNFDHPELFPDHTKTLSREVLRIALNQIHGWVDLSSDSQIASKFKKPHLVSAREIINFLYSKDFSNDIFNKLLEILHKEYFYEFFGYNIDKNKIKSPFTFENSRNYLFNLNKDFIYEDTLHELDGYNNIKNGDISDFAFKYNDQIYPLSKFNNSIGPINSLVNSIDNSRLLIKYKIPKQFLLDINVNEQLGPTVSKDGINIVAKYDKYSYLKNVHSLKYQYPFSKRHRENAAFSPSIPFFYNFHKYDRYYSSFFDSPIYENHLDDDKLNFHEIHKKGRMWEPFMTICDFKGNVIDQGLLDKYNKSKVPLNKQLFFDKLHASQTNKYGLAPTTGSYAGFNDGVYEFDYSFNTWDPNDLNDKAHSMHTKLSNLSLGRINWNYMNKLIFWPTFPSASVSIPPSTLIDEAHKNGVQLFGSIFPTSIQSFNELLFLDENNEMTASKKLSEFAKNIGFDGYFMNMEYVVNMPNWKDYYFRKKFFSRIRLFKKEAKKNGVDFIWYGHRRSSFLNAKNDYWNFEDAAILDNDELLTDDIQGFHFNYDDHFHPIKDDSEIPGREAYLNPYINWKHFINAKEDEEIWEEFAYYWSLEKKYKDKGYSGVLWQTWLSNSETKENWKWLLNNIYDFQKFVNPSEKSPEWWGDINVYGGEMYRPSDEDYIHLLRDLGNDFEETYPSAGVNKDPRDSKASSYAKFIQERSVIDGTKSFRTNFSLDNSQKYFFKGKPFKVGNSYIAPTGAYFQSNIYPTYKWMTDIYDLNDNPLLWTLRDDFNKEIKTSFWSLDEVYNGNNAIKYSGTIPAHSKFINKLYASKINNSNTKNWQIIFKGNINPKLVSWDESNNRTEFSSSDIEILSNGWKKITFHVHSGISKYFGIELENTSNNPITLQNEFINEIQWNKTGDDIIATNDELNKMNPSGEMFYDDIKNTYSINGMLNIKFQDQVFYEIYSLDNNNQTDRLLSWNSTGIFRDPLVNYIEENGLLHSNYRVISRNFNNDIIGQKDFSIYFQKQSN